TPVSFIHQIQKPLYRYRPIVPISQDLNLIPQIHEDGLVASVPSSGPSSSLSSLGGIGLGRNSGALQLPQTETPRATLRHSDSAVPASYAPADGLRELAATRRRSAYISGESSVETAAPGTEVGELSGSRVEQPVAVRRDRSGLIPILQTSLDGGRVSVEPEA